LYVDADSLRYGLLFTPKDTLFAAWAPDPHEAQFSQLLRQYVADSAAEVARQTVAGTAPKLFASAFGPFAEAISAALASGELKELQLVPNGRLQELPFPWLLAETPRGPTPSWPFLGRSLRLTTPIRAYGWVSRPRAGTTPKNKGLAAQPDRNPLETALETGIETWPMPDGISIHLPASDKPFGWPTDGPGSSAGGTSWAAWHFTR